MGAEFEALGPDDPRWASTVDAAGADVFYRPEYVRFVTRSTSHAPVLLRYADDLGVVFDVTLIKRVDTLPFYADIARDFARPPVDLASPEYNGPVVASAPADRAELVRRYRAALDAYCRNTGVVTEFVRVHPLSDLDVATGLGACEPLRDAAELIYVDLRAGYEAAARGYRKGHRAAVKRAAREGAVVRVVPPDDAAVARLAELYGATMARHGAKGYYRHDTGYFTTLFEHLGDRALLVEASTREGALAASAVFLRGARHLWYLYAGTAEALRDTGANNYKIDRMVAWGAAHGCEALVLGGGFAPGDGLYLTKRGYSHLAAPVRHLRKVHDVRALERLRAARAAYNARHGRPTREDYFPSYWLD
jgi:hypothetical protein